MKSFHNVLRFISILLLMLYVKGSLQTRIPTVTSMAESENCFNSGEISEFKSYYGSSIKVLPAPDQKKSTCSGAGFITTTFEKLCSMKPDNDHMVKLHFYFSSKGIRNRVQVIPGKKIVHYKASKKTVMIVHGFRSSSKESWVLAMTTAFLNWGDVNVIAVDWSGDAMTWSYGKAVANSKVVGSKIYKFLKQLMRKTGAKVKDFHFVGHSLGAHISAFASNHLRGVGRITGLDPAQPCFTTSNDGRLDKADADFVDIIHTNAREMRKMGLGLPDPIVSLASGEGLSYGTCADTSALSHLSGAVVRAGDAAEAAEEAIRRKYVSHSRHVDFYPNGGMKQPGCFEGTRSRFTSPLSKFKATLCSHARAHSLFTQSLINNNNANKCAHKCSNKCANKYAFQAHSWDSSYKGIELSLKSNCKKKGSCAEMGINANSTPNARGSYFLLTTATAPYCVSPKENRLSREQHKDLRKNLIWTQTPRPALFSKIKNSLFYG